MDGDDSTRSETRHAVSLDGGGVSFGVNRLEAVKFLHTSDWHVGKAIRGHSRAAEHEAVLSEIVAVADRESVDLVIVAGDQFETAAPSPDAERLVYDTFLRLAEIAPVVALSGNHDNPRRFAAVQPLLELGRITIATEVRRPSDGGVVSLDLAGTPVQIAMIPFVSQRGIVRADQLMREAAFEHAQSYAQRMTDLVAALTAGFDGDSVNIVAAHAFVQGGQAGGGERGAHLADEYGVPAVAFPATANYVALGHLHRPQVVRGATAIHYCGSPLQLDFGEEAQTKQVNVVTAEPGLPSKVEAVELTSGRSLRTVRGTLAQLGDLAKPAPGTLDLGGGHDLPADLRDAWLRVQVNEPARAGLANEVRELLGDGVVDVMIDHEAASQRPVRRRRDGRTPQELFAAFLDERDIVDERLNTAFAELLDDSVSSESPGVAS